MQMKKELNNQGVVLITVVVIVILILMLVVAIVHMNVSQTMLTEDEYKRVQNQLLAESALALIHAEQQTVSPPASDTYAFTLNGINHTVSYTVSAGGLHGSSIVAIDVSY